jgi:hypothetical protein
VAVVSNEEVMREEVKKEGIEETAIAAGDQGEIRTEETNGNVSNCLKKSLPLPGFKIKGVSTLFKAYKKESYVTAEKN